MDFSKRSQELELIDLGLYSQEEYKDCLEQLSRVGVYLGGDRASLKEIRKCPSDPFSILDVGCGGGGFTQKLGKRYPQSTIVGIDLSADAIAHAINQNKESNVTFSLQHLKDLPSHSYDVVIATLVCHHLSDEQLPLFLQDCLRVAKKKVILNDLQRHPLAWILFSLVAPPLFRNRLITHDGRLSIKRAFKRDDWDCYLKKVQGKVRIYKRWPFRWIVILEPLK